MDIYEALEIIGGYMDMFANQGALSDEECDEIGVAENVIYQFARKHEPRTKNFLIEFTCDCGAHMIRKSITDSGYAEFICPKCNAMWLL